MYELIGITIASAIAGGLWRRFFGGWLPSGIGLGRLRMIPGTILFFLVGWYATQSWEHGLIVAAWLTLGYGDGVLFNPQKPLVYRYGFVTCGLALILVYLGHWAYWYAPIGCLVYFGYAIPKYLADRWWKDGCYSCVGEVVAGAIIIGPLPLLRWIG